MEYGSEVFVAAPDGTRRELLRQMAARGPVHRVTFPSGSPGWLVTGNAEARIALTDPRLARGTAGIIYLEESPEAAAGLQNHMLNQNPPDHTRLRKLITAAFTRRRVENLAPQIEAIATELIDEMAPLMDRGETVDLLPSFAYPFPFRVICTLLGIPTERGTELGPRLATLARGTVSGARAYSEAANEVLRFLRQLIEAKRREPGDDLASALVRVHDGDDRLTENELTAMMYLLVIAGHETTSGLLLNSTLALLRHPNQLSLVRAKPELVDVAVEETLRYDAPVQATFPAVALETFQLGGHTIRQGDRVSISPMAAGLDPTVNNDPDSFDLTRTAVTHLAFSHGIHYCLGAPLARLEARIGLRTLLGRFPTLELADHNLERVPAMLFNSSTALRIRSAAR